MENPLSLTFAGVAKTMLCLRLNERAAIVGLEVAFDEYASKLAELFTAGEIKELREAVLD